MSSPSSPCGPEHAPAGDVGTAIMMIDSRLKSIHSGNTEAGSEQQVLTDQLLASLSAKEADDVLDGTCTIIYSFMKWLRMAHEDHGKDVIEYVVPSIVATMRMMTRSIRPETIPTMAGLVIAAATDLSPSLWREQYGDWTAKEMNSLEATAFLLADHINRITDDPDFATHMITQALDAAAADAPDPDDDQPPGPPRGASR